METEDVMNFVKGGQSVADWTSGATVLAILSGENATGLALAAVSIGAVVVPRAIDWWRQFQGARTKARIDEWDAESLFFQRHAEETAQLKADLNRAREEAVRLKADMIAAKTQANELNARPKRYSTTCPYSGNRDATCTIRTEPTPDPDSEVHP